MDQLPVKTTLLQNYSFTKMRTRLDQLPVKTTLLQNTFSKYLSHCQISYQSKRRCSKTVKLVTIACTSISYQSKRRCSKTSLRCRASAGWISYQSKRRCSKTVYPGSFDNSKISYQSKRRCSKTASSATRKASSISYQSKRRCSKTTPSQKCVRVWISYQSKRRCSKTSSPNRPRPSGSVTSQNDAAPKLDTFHTHPRQDQLPVKTTLLQNLDAVEDEDREISYQSKRRCSKTRPLAVFAYT